MKNSGWIGVDLDGTLAYYDEWRGINHIGAPIKLMADRVREWIADGVEVRIFTARVGVTKDNRDPEQARQFIQAWCLMHFGKVLEVTNLKDFGMIELWDDRCIQVRANTGVPVYQPK